MADLTDAERFERWLRSSCFQAPTTEAHDLAWSAWQTALSLEGLRARDEEAECKTMREKCDAAWENCKVWSIKYETDTNLLRSLNDALREAIGRGRDEAGERELANALAKFRDDHYFHDEAPLIYDMLTRAVIALRRPSVPQGSVVVPRETLATIAEQLAEAAEDVESWGGYAGAYFQEKHHLAKNIQQIKEHAAKVRAILAPPVAQIEGDGK